MLKEDSLKPAQIHIKAEIRVVII